MRNYFEVMLPSRLNSYQGANGRYMNLVCQNNSENMIVVDAIMTFAKKLPHFHEEQSMFSIPEVRHWKPATMLCSEPDVTVAVTSTTSSLMKSS